MPVALARSAEDFAEKLESFRAVDSRNGAPLPILSAPDDGKNYHVYIAISEPERDRLVSLLRGSTSKANY